MRAAWRPHRFGAADLSHYQLSLWTVTVAQALARHCWCQSVQCQSLCQSAAELPVMCIILLFPRVIIIHDQ